MGKAQASYRSILIKRIGIGLVGKLKNYLTFIGIIPHLNISSDKLAACPALTGELH